MGTQPQSIAEHPRRAQRTKKRAAARTARQKQSTSAASCGSSSLSSVLANDLVRPFRSSQHATELPNHLEPGPRDKTQTRTADQPNCQPCCSCAAAPVHLTACLPDLAFPVSPARACLCNGSNLRRDTRCQPRDAYYRFAVHWPHLLVRPLLARMRRSLLTSRIYSKRLKCTLNNVQLAASGRICRANGTNGTSFRRPRRPRPPTC